MSYGRRRRSPAHGARQAAPVQLLEIMISPGEEDTLSNAERKAIVEADEWLEHNEPVPHEEVLADLHDAGKWSIAGSHREAGGLVVLLLGTVRTAVREEMARRLPDLFRRLGYLPWERVPVDALDTAAALMGDELGWSDDAREREKRSVLRE